MAPEDTMITPGPELLLGAIAVVVYLLAAVLLVPYVAKQKRARWWAAWVFVGLIMSPVLALIALAALPDRRERQLLARLNRRLAPPAPEPERRSPGDRLFGRRG